MSDPMPRDPKPAASEKAKDKPSTKATSKPSKPRRTRAQRRLLLALAAVVALLLVAGVWYVKPYVEGESEYARVRDIASGEQPEPADGWAPWQPKADEAGQPQTPMSRTIDWDALRAVNPDVIGWIYVPNTPIDYPVVQAPTDDESKYLHTTFEGAVAWPNNQGTIYLDAGNIEDGLYSDAPLVYGHYQLNDSMFSEFSKNYELDHLNGRSDIYVYTPDGNIHIEAFAARKVNARRERVRVSFQDKADLNSWFRERYERADAIRYDPGDLDQIWTFVTCSYSDWNDQRTLTYARTVEDTRPRTQFRHAVEETVRRAAEARARLVG